MPSGAVVCDHRSMETTPAPPRPRPPAATRPWRDLARSRSSRVIGGVAGGLGHHLGIDPLLVRIAFAVLAFAGGTGILLYGVLWVLVPVEADPRAAAPTGRRPPTAQQGIALALITLGVLLLLRAVGLWFGDALVFPVVLAAAGSAIVWGRSDREQRAAWSRLASRVPGQAVATAASSPASPVRIVIGTLLVAGAIAGFLAANDALVQASDLLLAVVAALVGVGLLFGPWLWRLVDQLGEERRQRIRQEERAELAAHLHDSVLQTLALIQRNADQPHRMMSLARRQERELRAWLYGAAAPDATPTTIAAAMAALTEELEAAHDIVLEAVLVGDAPLDERASALLAAIREACTNVAKHAGVPGVDVYLEVEEAEVVAFVRDRGAGFDPASVPGDRQGIRRSIVERVERHGGAVTIRSAPGEGTEVELCVPRRTRPTNGHDANGSPAGPTQGAAPATSPSAPPPGHAPPRPDQASSPAAGLGAPSPASRSTTPSPPASPPEPRS